MSVLTEAALRVLLKDEDLDELREWRVDADVIVTPSAKAYLTDHKIDLLIGDKRVIKNKTPEGAAPKPAQRAQNAPRGGENGNLPAFEKPARYESIYGGSYAEKPEHMTAVRGTLLVNKDHPTIVLRGRVDSLAAKILEVQVALRRLGLEKAVADLGEVLAYTYEILRSEVVGDDLAEMKLLGMDEAEIRARSHAPQKYYGHPHFAPTVDDGEAVVLLNSLRTAVREVEIAAYGAFKDEYGIPTRGDIVQGFNRLSSVFYLMMFRAKTGEYGP